MASLKKKSMAPLKSVDISSLSKATPYIQRIVQDAKLRENVRTAYDSSRSAYSRLTNGKAPAKALMEDKKLQHDLRETLEALRDASIALTEAPRKRVRKGRRLGRKLLVLMIGAGVALAGSEKLRSKVLDALFGAEEEFEYSSTTTSSSAPQPAGAAT